MQNKLSAALKNVGKNVQKISVFFELRRDSFILNYKIVLVSKVLRKLDEY